MATADSRTSDAGPPIRILLVDDNAPGRRALAKMLESQGYQVTAVADGTSALAELGQEPPPQFVLTDLILPDVDGSEVAQAAKLLVPAPYVALITGWSLETDKQQAKDFGVDHVFLKPLPVAELLAKLREVTDRTKGDRSS